MGKTHDDAETPTECVHFSDFRNACTKAVKAAHKKMHELARPESHRRTFTDPNADTSIIPKKEEGTKPALFTVTLQASYDDITAQATVRKLEKVKLRPNKEGTLPFPFNSNQLITPKQFDTALLEHLKDRWVNKMGASIVGYDTWNTVDNTAEWIVRTDRNGIKVAEYICVTIAVKRNRA